MNHLPSGWPRRALVELQANKKWALNGGPFGSKLVQRDYIDFGVPVIRGVNLPNDAKFNDNDFVYVSERKADELRANNAHPGDVIFTQRGTLGQVGLIPIKSAFLRYVISQSQMKMTVDERQVLPEWIYYYFTAPLTVKELMNKAFSSGVPHINLGILREFQVPVPPIPSQRKIISILSAYDDLIENNLRRIKILEEMAQNLYREWFVKYRFPGHQSARFVDSPLGRIPEGWEVKTLASLVTIDKGISYKGEFLTDEGIPMVNLKCISPGGGFNRNGTKPYAGEHKSRHKIVSGDLVFANTDLTQAGNIIGSPGIVPRSGFEQGGIATHHICIVRVNKNSPVSETFLFYLLQLGGFREYAKSCASGTTVLGFRADDALVFEFALPTNELTKRFENIASDVLEHSESLNKKNTLLRRTRDLLLPRLISGELDVSELDIAVPEEAE